MAKTQRTVDEVLDQENWSRAGIVKLMRDNGWEDAPGGGVRHKKDHSKSYLTYFDAIMACIEVASDL